MRRSLLLLVLALAACPSTADILDFDEDGVRDEEDCEPTDPTIFPGAVEIVGDGVDQDCDGLDDVDLDGDGSPSLLDCDDANELLDALDRDADGFSLCDGDCDDQDDAIHPDATELPGDGADQDCDGFDDVDADGDGAYSLNDCDDTDPDLNLDDLDGDGASNCAEDCDDGDPALNPNDEDGDGETSCEGDCDDDDGTRNTLDEDGDGATTCQAEPDCNDNSAQLNLHDVDSDTWSTCDGDCADTDSARHPAATERCNELDDDCDGVLAAFELDLDSDGDLGCEDCDDNDPTVTGTDTDSDGFSPCTGDCAEGNATIFPGAPDPFGDGGDQNCDGVDGLDADGDGFAANASPSPDCLDSDPTVYPGAPEICDGLDSDCVLDPSEIDGDSDGAAPCEGDCDDGDPALNLLDADGDNLDSCSGDCDDGDPLVNLTDNDGDGPSGCAGDCDDDDPLVNPSASEVCDGIDNDCDGVTGSPDTFIQPAGPDLQTAYEVLVCGIFEVAVGAQITGFDMRLQPSWDSTITMALFEGATVTGPWTRQWVSTPSGVTSAAMQWFPSGAMSRTLTAGGYTALCINATSDVSWPGSWGATGLPAATSFGTYVSGIDEIEFTSMPLGMGSTGWPTWVPIRVHTITSEADGDGDGESACTDCDDSDPGISNSDGDSDGLTGCDGDCDDGDGTIPRVGLDTPWDLTDTDCDGTDHTGIEEGTITVLGAAGGRFGSAVLVVPDVNSDGVDDVFVSEPQFDGAAEDTGRIVLLSGAALLAGTADPSSPLAQISGSELDDQVGENMVLLPDLDLDGFPELAVWSPEQPYPAARKGEVLIFASQGGTWGGLTVLPADAALHIVPPSASAPFSTGMSAGGDLDGDGQNDLVILSDSWSVGYETDEGAALVFTAGQLAAALGGADLGVADAWLTLRGEFTGEHQGMWARAMSDLDSDGRHELLVGTASGPREWTGFEWFWPNRGQVHVVLSGDVAQGGTCVLSLTGCTTTIITGVANSDRWFRAVPAGDLDSDGLEEILIGSIYVATAGNYRGAIGVYSGADLLAGGTLGVPDADGWIEGAADFDFFAGLVLPLGDLDADGLPEILALLDDVGPGGFGRPGSLVLPGASLAATLTGPTLDPTIATIVFAALDLDAGIGAGGPLGDLDGDGSPEIWLASPYRDVTGTNDGSLHVIELP